MKSADRSTATAFFGKIRELRTSGGGGVEAMKYRSVIQKLGKAIEDGYAAQRKPDEIDANLALPAGTADFYQAVMKDLPSAHERAGAALKRARDLLKRARDDR